MENRMNRYDSDSERFEKRTKRNEELYNSISKNQIDEYNVNSNVSVLDEEPGNEIDVEKLKDILSKRYEKPYQRRSITIEAEQDTFEVPLETKDYDLSKILEQAKADKSIDYSEERLKKLHSTQYDILKKIDLNNEKEEQVVSAEEELMTMIKTITEKEDNKNFNKEADFELDLLHDLKGSDDTEVIPPITDEQKEQYDITKKKEDLDNSFYTDSLKVNPQDFEDFKELKEEISSNSNGIKILVFLFSIILLLGLLFLFDKIFSWGIF